MATSVRWTSLLLLISFMTFSTTQQSTRDSSCWAPGPSNISIIGGHDAREFQFPFMVALEVKFSDGQSLQCGGTLLSTIWILTAGHCLSSEGKSVTSVTVGYDSVELNHMKTVNIENFFVHEHYRFDPISKAMYNDIALVKLSAPLPDSPGVIPICFAGPQTTYFGRVVATGWGWSAVQSTTNILQYTTLDMITMQYCRNFFSSLVQLDEKLCTFTLDKGTWKGDSGGPIVAQLSSGNIVQIGVVSFGNEVRPDINPDVYTKVSSYAPWICYIAQIC